MSTSTDVAGTLGLGYADLLRTQCLVGGKWVDANDGSVLPVLNPATGALLVEVPKMGADEATAAVEAARSAPPHCSPLPLNFLIVKCFQAIGFKYQPASFPTNAVRWGENNK